MEAEADDKPRGFRGFFPRILFQLLHLSCYESVCLIIRTVLMLFYSVQH